MNRKLRPLSLVALAVVLASCDHLTTGAVPHPAGASGQDKSLVRYSAPSGPSRRVASVRANCGAVPDGFARCFSLVRTDAFARTFPDQSGYGPSDLQAAYKLPSVTAGSGQTVAVVDAYDDSTAESDLQIYRSHFSLPDCTTANGCFSKVNQRGDPQPLPGQDSGWAAEISLDLDMVSAVCPNCHILLVEADDASNKSLGKSVDTAARLGANAISTSFGSSEIGSRMFERHYFHPGHMITASIGDNGVNVSFPGSSPDVTAVGGTTLIRAHNRRGWTDAIWSGVSPQCSAVYPKPSWQVNTGCAMRASGDVGAVADPNTGVTVVFRNQFAVFGGTSVSSPIIAGVYALAGNSSTLHFGQHSYNNLKDLFTVRGFTSHSCANACRDSQGYTGSTGNGTPHGVGAF
ncbi:MAG TPA: S8 family serine peptidase [Candidatus Eremiobacteraceae bacterium]